MLSQCFINSFLLFQNREDFLPRYICFDHFVYNAIQCDQTLYFSSYMFSVSFQKSKYLWLECSQGKITNRFLLLFKGILLKASFAIGL